MNDLRTSFGGSLLTGKRKTARALSTKNPIDLVLKSSGNRFFSPGNSSLERLIYKFASKNAISIRRMSLNWSHIHMIIQIPSRAAYNAFIRALTAAVVRAVSKFKGTQLKGIFDLRPFTRILKWGRDLKNVMAYHDLNDLEARGYSKRTEKKTRDGRRDTVNSSRSSARVSRVE